MHGLVYIRNTKPGRVSSGISHGVLSLSWGKNYNDRIKYVGIILPSIGILVWPELNFSWALIWYIIPVKGVVGINEAMSVVLISDKNLWPGTATMTLWLMTRTRSHNLWHVAVVTHMTVICDQYHSIVTCSSSLCPLWQWTTLLFLTCDLWQSPVTLATCCSNLCLYCVELMSWPWIMRGWRFS